MRQLDDLKVKAGMTGVLQVGAGRSAAQQVGPGTNLARVANPTNLKAELRIAETQTKDIRSARSPKSTPATASSQGSVSRIDPASTNGTVGVDVILDGALPPGARPDLSVDGTIRLEQLDNIIYVGRPAFGQEEQHDHALQARRERRGASRTKVKLGRSSVNTIEIMRRAAARATR